MSSIALATVHPSPQGFPLPKIGTLIPNRIFVGGINSNTTEDELRAFFSVFGSIKDVKVIYDKSGLSKGSYGFVTFDNQETVESIIKNQSETLVFKDRKLNIGYAVRKQHVFPKNDLGSTLLLAHNTYTVPNGLSVLQLCSHDHSTMPMNQPTIIYPATLMISPTMISSNVTSNPNSRVSHQFNENPISNPSNNFTYANNFPAAITPHIGLTNLSRSTNHGSWKYISTPSTCGSIGRETHNSQALNNTNMVLIGNENMSSTSNSYGEQQFQVPNPRVGPNKMFQSNVNRIQSAETDRHNQTGNGKSTWSDHTIRSLIRPNQTEGAEQHATYGNPVKTTNVPRNLTTGFMPLHDQTNWFPDQLKEAMTARNPMSQPIPSYQPTLNISRVIEGNRTQSIRSDQNEYNHLGNSLSNPIQSNSLHIDGNSQPALMFDQSFLWPEADTSTEYCGRNESPIEQYVSEDPFRELQKCREEVSFNQDGNCGSYVDWKSRKFMNTDQLHHPVSNETYLQRIPSNIANFNRDRLEQNRINSVISKGSRQEPTKNTITIDSCADYFLRVPQRYTAASACNSPNISRNNEESASSSIRDLMQGSTDVAELGSPRSNRRTPSQSVFHDEVKEIGSERLGGLSQFYLLEPTATKSNPVMIVESAENDATGTTACGDSSKLRK